MSHYKRNDLISEHRIQNEGNKTKIKQVFGCCDSDNLKSFKMGRAYFHTFHFVGDGELELTECGTNRLGTGPFHGLPIKKLTSTERNNNGIPYKNNFPVFLRKG